MGPPQQTPTHVFAAAVRCWLQIYADITNTDQRYMRNRLRLSVFPQLQGINSAAVEHICSLAEIARLEDGLLNNLAANQLAAAQVCCHLVEATPVEEPVQQRGLQGSPAVAAVATQPRPLEATMQTDCHPSAAAAAATSVCADKPAQTTLQQDASLQHRRSSQGAEIQPAAEQCCQYDHQEQEQGFAVRQHHQNHHQQQCHQPIASADTEPVGALQVSVLLQQHPALQRRVVHMWLAQQTGRAVRTSQVQEVLALLRPDRHTGDKTSTLWRSSCVLRHQELLLLLNVHALRQLMHGEVRLQLQQPAYVA